MFKSLTSKLIAFSVLPIAVFSVQRFSNNPIGSTTLWWLIEAIILILFLIGRFIFFEEENRKNFRYIKWYLFYVMFSLIRGIFMTEMYWDYKALVGNVFTLLMPVVAYTASNKDNLQLILSYFVKYALPFSVLFIPFLGPGDWGWYFFPISFIMLFFPLLNFKWKVIVLLLSLIVILGDISVRSHIFKYGIPMLLLVFYYFRAFIISNKILEVIRKAFIIFPFLFFTLAVSGVFNIFKISDYVGGDYGGYKRNAEGEKQQGIAVDSRTFMYEEVLQSALKYNYLILGRSPARGNETFAFAEFTEEITGRNERLRNEANIPNVLTWMGIVGVFLYFLVYFKASYISIKYSNNIYSKLIGLFVAFRWLYAWLEDAYYFDMNNFVIWLLIGACFSDSFRRMNNAEVKLWLRSVFSKKYYEKYREYTLAQS